MISYEFRCSAGHPTERRLPITASRRPSRVACSHIGCPLPARRVFNAQLEINAKPCSSQFPYTSFRLPTNLPGCRTATKAGHVVIESAAHKDRVFKTHGFVRESGEWC